MSECFVDLPLVKTKLNYFFEWNFLNTELHSRVELEVEGAPINDWKVLIFFTGSYEIRLIRLGRRSPVR